MKIWIITDTHLGHDKMVELCGRHPDFSEIILRNLSSLGRNGVLIHLGDVCIGNDDIWHKRIQECTEGLSRILVRGNHDRKSNSWYMSRGWSFVAETITDRLFGVSVCLSHFPTKDIGYGINVHGHFHNSDHRRHEPGLVAIKNPKQRLLAIEHTKLCAVNLEKFLKSPPTQEQQ